MSDLIIGLILLGLVLASYGLLQLSHSLMKGN